jgi:anti-sigma regulatory factor (Ser/Thr protein kinase)
VVDRQVITLPPIPTSVATARHFAEDAAQTFHPTGEAMERVRLLVSELATNVVRHAHTPMRLTVTGGDSRRVRVEVRDDEPQPPYAGRHPALMDTGGRGIFLVEALASCWGVNGNEKGKTVWFELDPTG